jgi:rhomboid protease GluP
MMQQPPTDTPQPPAGFAAPQPLVRFTPIIKKPWVTYTLVALTILIFIGQYLTEALLGYDLPYIYGGKINELILAGQIWRLLTPVLLHASILHIGFNMYALYVIGPGLETYYGHTRFLLLYLISGFAGNVLSFVLSPNPSIGASTAIFGLVTAEAVFIYRNRFMFKNYQRQLYNLLFILGVNLLLGLSPRIDNYGHLGGLLGGLIFAWLAGPLMQLQPRILGLEYDLVDRREQSQTLLGAAVTLGIFILLTASKFIL